MHYACITHDAAIAGWQTLQRDMRTSEGCCPGEWLSWMMDDGMAWHGMPAWHPSFMPLVKATTLYTSTNIWIQH